MNKIYQKTMVIFVENASRNMGGEAIKIFGFIDFVNELFQKIIIVTHKRNIDEIHKSNFKDLKFIFIDDDFLQSILYRLHPFYRIRFIERFSKWGIALITQMRARHVIRKVVETYDVVAVYQLTPISPGLPSLLDGYGAPLLIGPLAVDPGLPGRRLGRNLEHIAITALRIMHRVFSGKRRADVIFVANPETASRLERFLPRPDRFVQVLENGVDDSWFRVPRRPTAPPRIVFCGNLVWWKKVDLLLRAAAELGTACEVIIVGDGPERSALEALASGLGVAARFTGWRDKAFIQDVFASATAFVSASVRDAGGTAVQEAMAAGLPVVVTAWGGHLHRTVPGTGLLVDPSSDGTIIAGIRDGLRRLIDDPETAVALSDAARRHAYGAFRWSSIASTLIACIVPDAAGSATPAQELRARYHGESNQELSTK